MRFDIAAGAIVGTREEQQDAYAVGLARLDSGRSAKLVVVADGMGGHAGGAIASAVAVDGFVRSAGTGQWSSHAETLRQALRAANHAIAQSGEAEPAYDDMGCTLVGAILDEGRLWFISVGDSLLLRVAGGRLERLNADHSMAPLIDAAAGAPDASVDPALQMQRHMLRSALTGRPIPMIDEGEVALVAGDWLLVATDGLLTLAPDRILETLGREKGGAAGCVGALLDAVAACALPDQDNCTIMAIRTSGRAAASRRTFRFLAGALLLAAGLGAIAYAWHALPLDWRSSSVAVPAGGGEAGSRSESSAGGSERRAGFPRPALPHPKPPTPARAGAPPPSAPALAESPGPGSAKAGAVASPPAVTPPTAARATQERSRADESPPASAKGAAKARVGPPG
jgi:PPM family protein phosphatase